MADRSTKKSAPYEKTRPSLLEGARYRGGIGQWAWILHRLAGLGIMLFLVLHIIDIFLISFGPEIFNKLLFIYHSPVFKPLIVFLVFGVLYHALNGLRIVLIDIWPAMARLQKPMWTAAMIISLIVTGISTIAMLFP